MARRPDRVPLFSPRQLSEKASRWANEGHRLDSAGPPANIAAQQAGSPGRLGVGTTVAPSTLRVKGASTVTADRGSTLAVLGPAVRPRPLVHGVFASTFK